MRKPTDVVNIKIRCLEALRAKLESEAKKNCRSLNGEIVYRLGLTFGKDGATLAPQFEDAKRELMKVVLERLS
jgi:hypothetical protein